MKSNVVVLLLECVSTVVAMESHEERPKSAYAVKVEEIVALKNSLEDSFKVTVDSDIPADSGMPDYDYDYDSDSDSTAEVIDPKEKREYKRAVAQSVLACELVERIYDILPPDSVRELREYEEWSMREFGGIYAVDCARHAFILM
jgi:hypothetical protein